MMGEDKGIEGGKMPQYVLLSP